MDMFSDGGGVYPSDQRILGRFSAKLIPSSTIFKVLASVTVLSLHVKAILT